MMNLCTNAFHAMTQEKGVLSISLERVMLDAKAIGGQAGVSAGEFVKLAVNDTGCGMDAGTLGRIFEPYFTTKTVGTGTGLGLALVHGIVEGFGGMIEVKSAPGVGTAVQIFFPAHHDVAVAESAAESGSIPTGNERILVVDDERSIVNLLASSLGKLGYRVSGTTSSVEALALFQENPDAFDMIITDQTMPQMTGLELGRHIRDKRPEMPIIICSGYSSMLSEKEAGELGVTAVFTKPVERAKLVRCIRNVLDDR